MAENTIKQKVIRKTLTGAWEPFTFDVRSKSFFVKNFSESEIYVSFENNDEENESIKILPDMGEICFINAGYTLNGIYFVDTIYVKGTGEVEVEAIEY